MRMNGKRNTQENEKDDRHKDPNRQQRECRKATGRGGEGDYCEGVRRRMRRHEETIGKARESGWEEKGTELPLSFSLGWTVNEVILPCKVKYASFTVQPGLDGKGCTLAPPLHQSGAVKEDICMCLAADSVRPESMPLKESQGYS